MLRVPIACNALIRTVCVPRAEGDRQQGIVSGDLLFSQRMAIVPALWDVLPCLLDLPALQERSALPHSSPVLTLRLGNYIPFP